MRRGAEGGSGDDGRSEGMTIEGEIGKGDERSTCDLGQFQREFDLDDPEVGVQRGEDMKGVEHTRPGESGHFRIFQNAESKIQNPEALGLDS